MPVIDSRSDSKFDALIRTNKADALMSFIMATSNVKTENERKTEVAKRVKSAYELFRENIRNSSSGAGSYGDGSRDILEQFESHYTMGYEMGIWYDSDYHLNQLATKVSNYEITVTEYIGVVFLNLFSYFNKNGSNEYHHFLYEILNKAKMTLGINSNISKSLIAETLPIEKATEQANIIFNYLVDTDLFEQVDNNTMRLSEKWRGQGQQLLELCNLEYQNLTFEEAKELFKDKRKYSEYVTQIFSEEDTEDGVVREKGPAYFDKKERIQGGTNILLYGVPGSGKSWTIENEYCKKDSCVERLVFHPDYTYSDFIGQILPDVSEDGQVSYRFTPGPFTNILRDAYENPEREFILIIEEINRGNAPAIFGEVFQLLDRKVEIKEDDDEYPLGTSEYGITNKNIALVVYNNERHKVRIPSNLSIIGTMNTSDQNVFTLDTAFQRRWEMRLIENNFDNVDTTLADVEILDTGVTWRAFCESINEIIIGNNARMTSSEDKRLGAYFVHMRDLKYDSNANEEYEGEYNALCKKEKDRTLTEQEKTRLHSMREAMKQNRKFPEKVIKYLWDDAFKFSREVIFESNEYQSLEAIIRKFIMAKGFDRFAMFKQNVRDTFMSKKQK